MLNDNLFYRLARRFRRSQNQDEPPQSEEQTCAQSRRSKGGPHGHGVFNNSRHFVVKHPTFVENQVVIAGNQILNPVLENILPYTDLNATVDSSARYPPPLCHPGTRVKIGGRLDGWLADPDRQWNMIWLYGPAGTGKSAVAQSFAERCIKNNCLGATFFFSRANQRNNPNAVIPTLIYQLAVHNRDYKSLVAIRLADDPGLMRKARHVQFNRLIVEPLGEIQKHRQMRIQEPLLIVLDGLDECKGESAQRELIEMISEATRLKKDLPLLWLICSRPEAHLKYVFSRVDYTVNCGREELVIDAESIADVDFYIQDGLAGIRSHFEDVTTPTWPSRKQIVRLSKKARGHFGFASTALRYIGDEGFGSPMARFDHLLSFQKGATTDGAKNPLDALDALYAGILRDTPDEVLHLVKRILGCHIFVFPITLGNSSVQITCNFLRMDQATFYSALRKLHSVIDVPVTASALQTNLQFYHTSFVDYLQDPLRSDGFISNNDTWLYCAEMSLSWYRAGLNLFHAVDGFKFGRGHWRGSLPGLKWVSEDNEADISAKVACRAITSCWFVCHHVDEWNSAFLSQLRGFDFRYVWQNNFGAWGPFMNKLWKVDSSSGFIRTEPRNEIDLQLLEYLKVMTGSIGPVEPAQFPLFLYPYGKYFLLGNGLICDEPPSKEWIDKYQPLIVENEKKKLMPHRPARKRARIRLPSPVSSSE